MFAIFTIFFLSLTAATKQEVLFHNLEFSRFGERYDQALEAIFSVAVKLEALLNDTGAKTSHNFMVSPLSMAVAIGQLMLGAKGPLEQELYELLRVDTIAEDQNQTVRHITDSINKNIPHHVLHEQLGDLVFNLQHRKELNNEYVLKTASVLFAQHNLSINEDYKNLVRHFYGTEVQKVDFLNDPQGTEKICNKWVHDHTKGLIKSLVPGGFPTQTVAILTNAIYFNADWEIPFSSEINRVLPFRTSPKTSVNVTFMMGEFDNYKYVESSRLNCRMVIMPYKNKELSMHIVLPNENNGQEYNINKFVTNLHIKDILELRNTAKERKVAMIMPKMALSNTIKVLGSLRRYHSYKHKLESLRRYNSVSGDTLDQLNDRIYYFRNISSTPTRHSSLSLDLSGISSDEAFHLGEIYQQMTLSVHEMGTEAAAVSASIIEYMLGSVSVKVDRPFLFFIRDEQTDATLFWGTIVDPTDTIIT